MKMIKNKIFDVDFEEEREKCQHNTIEKTNVDKEHKKDTNAN